MRAIDNLIATKRISVTTIVLEGNNLNEKTMHRYQAVHGFRVYRLDVSDHRRHMTSKGWDQYSPKGTFAPLQGRSTPLRPHQLSWAPSESLPLPGWPRDALEEEVFSLRAMRHLWRVKENASIAEWRVLLGPMGQFNASLGKSHYRGISHQWMLTMEQGLVEPVLPPRHQKRVMWQPTAWSEAPLAASTR